MGKVGRPKIDNKREKRVTLRLSDEEYDKLNSWCKKNNFTLTETIVDALRLYFEQIEEANK